MPCPLQQRRQGAEVVRSEDDIDPGRPSNDLASVLLRQAAPDGDLHAGMGEFRRAKVPEVAVKPVVGILPNGAGVEHDDVGVSPCTIRTYPADSSSPAIRSESCAFIWQPYVRT